VAVLFPDERQHFDVDMKRFTTTVGRVVDQGRRRGGFDVGGGGGGGVAGRRSVESDALGRPFRLDADDAAAGGDAGAGGDVELGQPQLDQRRRLAQSGVENRLECTRMTV